MFESVCLGREISKKEYKAIEDELRTQLFDAQQKARKANIPVIIILSGLTGAGRGGVVNMISNFMDEKGIRNHTFWRETDEESERPYAWRFWRKMPKNGEIATFFGGWYGDYIRQLACEEITQDKFENIMHRWVSLEKALTASGVAIIKLWLHIDKETFKDRHEHRVKHNEERHFAPLDTQIHNRYDEIVKSAALAIKITDKVNASWTLIDAKNSRFRDATIARTIASEISKAVAIKKKRADGTVLHTPTTNISTINAIDLTKTISNDDYSKELKKLSKEIGELTYIAYQKGISSTIIFEGSDAAGKGGVIRRLSNSIDARITQVIPISAPTEIELAHHYLWRFWNHIPLNGFITIYDRSWYGRVLVERVEGFASPYDWGRAYAEINDFEDQLTENNHILLKFWLYVSPDEQLRRFKEREEIAWKNYKLTDEDWRNREKQDLYNEAADEMFLRTNTANAPWHVIPSESKKYARIEVLKIYKKRLEKAIKESKK